MAAIGLVLVLPCGVLPPTELRVRALNHHPDGGLYLDPQAKLPSIIPKILFLSNIRALSQCTLGVLLGPLLLRLQGFIRAPKRHVSKNKDRDIP